MKSQVKPLLIRTDASTQIGTGHLMRCLALAQAWQDTGGQVFFVMATKSPPLEARLHSEGIKVIHLPVQLGSLDDATQTADFARQVGAKWVVVDGYHFGADYQRAIKERGLRLLFIDDSGHAEHYYADLLLNQNIYAHGGLYQNREPYTRLLLGTRYVLLRREFLKWRRWKRKIPEVARKILVTMGGSDPDNVTLKVIQALHQVEVDGLEAIVVVGGSNPHYKKMQSAIQGSRFPIRLESNATNMSELMVWADVAVSAGGTTVWELVFMRIPVIGLSRAEQEEILLEHSTKYGISVNLGKHLYVQSQRIALVITALAYNKAQRLAMSRAGRSLVDGLGSERVISSIRKWQ